MVVSFMTVRGGFPKKSASCRSMGLLPPDGLRKVNWWSPVTSPMTYMGARSRRATEVSWSTSLLLITRPIRSCDSLPMISLAERVGSPTGSLLMSMVPPVDSTSSERQLRWPPAPWSWSDITGLWSLSAMALRALYTLFCISGLARCTALSSMALS